MWRTLLASPFLYGFIACIITRNAFPAPFFGLAAALIIAPALSDLFAEPAGYFYSSGKHSDRPQPAYSIYETKRAKGLYEEAIAGFEKIAAEYPEEVKPYIEMIDIAIVDLKDSERAKRIFYRGIAALKKDKDKEILTQRYRTELFQTPKTIKATTKPIT